MDGHWLTPHPTDERLGFREVLQFAKVTQVKPGLNTDAASIKVSGNLCC